MINPSQRESVPALTDVAAEEPTAPQADDKQAPKKQEAKPAEPEEPKVIQVDQLESKDKNKQAAANSTAAA